MVYWLDTIDQAPKVENLIKKVGRPKKPISASDLEKMRILKEPWYSTVDLQGALLGKNKKETKFTGNS